jgi:hypothetical protein
MEILAMRKTMKQKMTKSLGLAQCTKTKHSGNNETMRATLITTNPNIIHMSVELHTDFYRRRVVSRPFVTDVRSINKIRGGKGRTGLQLRALLKNT